jgi:HEAT repeat protein
MKSLGVVVVLFLVMFTASGLSQGSTLEEKVRAVLMQGMSFADLQGKLRQLGNENDVAAVLARFASTYRLSKEGSPEFLVLDGAVACLGELKARSANDLLSSFLTDRKIHENVRSRAARSLGQIDPEGNKQILLRALDPTVSDHYLIRVYAAEGLAKTRDAEALKAVERYSREERDSYVRQQFEKAAQAMRANGVRPKPN